MSALAQNLLDDPSATDTQPSKPTLEADTGTAVPPSLEKAADETAAAFLSRTFTLTKPNDNEVELNITTEAKTESQIYKNETKEIIRISDESIRQRVVNKENSFKPEKSDWIEYIANFWNATEKPAHTEKQLYDFNLIDLDSELKITVDDAFVAYKVLETDYDSVMSQEIIQAATNTKYRQALETADTIYGNGDGRTDKSDMLNYYTALLNETLAEKTNSGMTLSATVAKSTVTTEPAATLSVDSSVEGNQSAEVETQTPAPTSSVISPEELKTIIKNIYPDVSLDEKIETEEAPALDSFKPVKIKSADPQAPHFRAAAEDKVKRHDTDIESGRQKKDDKKEGEVSRKNIRTKEPDVMEKLAKSRSETAEIARMKKLKEDAYRKQQRELEETRKRLYDNQINDQEEENPLKNTKSEELVSGVTSVR